jgi:alkylhydroperoxidase family enzyme
VEDQDLLLQRLNYDDLAPELRALLAEKYRRLGYLGEFFQVTGHQPAVVAEFIRFSNAIGKALPLSLHEVIALATSRAMDNDYERFQHERRALKLGYSEEWIRAAENGAMPNSLDESERVTRRLAFAMAQTTWHGGGSAMAQAEAVLGAECLVAVVLAVARFVAHATVAHAFQLSPPVSSPLDVHSDPTDESHARGES